MDPYLKSIRRALNGARESRGPVTPDWQKGQSGNHELAIVVGNYALDPHGPWRSVLISWLTNMLRVKGLWCSRFDDELGTSSHKAHWYSGQDPLLYFALLYGDAEVLALVMELECAVHAVETLCVTPAGDIVMPGARCHFGNPKAADQREQGNRRWQWLTALAAADRDGGKALRKVRMPKLLATADDWLGLYALTLIRNEMGTPELLKIANSNTVADLPAFTHNGLAVERTSKGHVARLLSVNGTIRPAIWAMAEYDKPGSETYGVGVDWSENYRPLSVDEVPPLPCPGGPGKVTVVRAAA